MRVGRVFVALIGAVALASCGGDGGDSDSGEPSFKATPVALGDGVEPDELALGADGRLWIAVNDEVASVDPKTRTLASDLQRVDTGSSKSMLYDLAAGDEGVWAIAKEGGSVFVVPADEATARDGERAMLDFNGLGLRAGDTLKVAVGEARVWGIQTGEVGVSIVDPDTGDESGAHSGNTQDIAVGAGSGWAVSKDVEFASSGGQLDRVDPRTGDAKRFQLDDDPSAVAVGAGAVWILFEGYVTRYDRNGREGPSIELGDIDASEGDIAVGPGVVWAVAQDSRQVVRIDPRTNKLLGDPIALPAGEPGDLVAIGDEAWVTMKDKSPVRIAPTG